MKLELTLEDDKSFTFKLIWLWVWKFIEWYRSGQFYLRYPFTFYPGFIMMIFNGYYIWGVQ